MERRKTLSLRLPKETWNYLKKLAIDRDTTLNDLICDRLNKYKEKTEKKLTRSDTMVS